MSEIDELLEKWRNSRGLPRWMLAHRINKITVKKYGWRWFLGLII